MEEERSRGIRRGLEAWVRSRRGWRLAGCARKGGRDLEDLQGTGELSEDAARTNKRDHAGIRRERERPMVVGKWARQICDDLASRREYSPGKDSEEGRKGSGEI